MSALLSSTARTAPQPDLVARETRLLMRSGELLGAGKVFRHRMTTRFEVHEAIVGGALPFAALLYFISAFKALDENDFVQALCISSRTLRRRRETPAKAMPADLASKAWLVAETLAKASEIFGSKDEAEAWMIRPAIGLDGQRPIDMLQTVQGAELVNDFLTRLEYDVYS